MLASRQITVGSTVVELTDGLDVDQEYVVRISHVGGSGTLGLGGADLGSSNAYLADLPLEMTVQDDPLFAIVPSGLGTSVTVSILVRSA